MSKKKQPIQNGGHLGIDELREIQENDVMSNLFNVKHPATILEYVQPSFYTAIERETPLSTVGVDIETDSEGNMKLLGLYNGDKYSFIVDKKPQEFMDWFAELLSKLYLAKRKDGCLVAWSEMDGIFILKTMLQALNLSDDEQLKILERWGHVEGVWERGSGWTTEPLIKMEVEIKKSPKLIQDEDGEWVESHVGKKMEFGVKQAIKGSVVFYLLPEEANTLQTISMFDISALSQKNLQDTCNEYGVNYVKADKEFHLVDWEKFYEEKLYRMNVLKSNMDDAKAVKELSDSISEHYAETFKKMIPVNGQWTEVKKYPSGLWSSGTLTTFALSMNMSQQDRSSINWTEQMKDWTKSGITQEELKDLYLQSIEGYKSGLFESFKIGKAQKNEKIFTSDISSSYPFIMANLYDLRGSKIKRGIGRPKKPSKTSYVLARATATDVSTWHYHTIGVKEPKFEEAIIRPSGKFKATAFYQEWELLEQQGATVEFIDWVEIETTGEPHPLVKVINKLWKKRMTLEKKYKETGNKAFKTHANAVKLVMNSIYGKMFEAIRKFEEGTRKNELTGEEYEVIFMKGFKAGQLFNPLLASLITAMARIRLVEMLIEIDKKGGEPVMAQADAIFWKGKGTELPKAGEFQSILGDYHDGLRMNGWTTDKTLGAWTEPEECFNFITVGTGRYSYNKADGTQVVKVRGMQLNVLGFKQEGTTATPIVENLEDMLKTSIKKKYKNKYDDEIILSEMTLLGTPQYCVHKKDPSFLGKEAHETLEIVVNSLFPKRYLAHGSDSLTHKDLLNGMHQTYAPSEANFTVELDGTIPVLRERILKNEELILWETKEIAKTKKQQHNQTAYQELKALSKFFGMSQDNFKKWRSTIGIEAIREEARAKGFYE